MLNFKTLASACVVAAVPLMVGFTSPTSTDDNTISMDGKSAFVDQGCNTCHSVKAADIAAEKEGKAPDLSKVGGKWSDGEKLKKYLLKEEELDGKKHKKKAKEAGLDGLVKFIQSLK